jgi:hypothetical protein
LAPFGFPLGASEVDLLIPWCSSHELFSGDGQVLGDEPDLIVHCLVTGRPSNGRKERIKRPAQLNIFTPRGGIWGAATNQTNATTHDAAQDRAPGCGTTNTLGQITVNISPADTHVLTELTASFFCGLLTSLANGTKNHATNCAALDLIAEGKALHTEQGCGACGNRRGDGGSLTGSTKGKCLSCILIRHCTPEILIVLASLQNLWREVHDLFVSRACNFTSLEAGACSNGSANGSAATSGLSSLCASTASGVLPNGTSSTTETQRPNDLRHLLSKIAWDQTRVTKHTTGGSHGFSSHTTLAGSLDVLLQALTRLQQLGRHETLTVLLDAATETHDPSVEVSCRYSSDPAKGCADTTSARDTGANEVANKAHIGAARLWLWRGFCELLAFTCHASGNRLGLIAWVVVRELYVAPVRELDVIRHQLSPK